MDYNSQDLDHLRARLRLSIDLMPTRPLLALADRLDELDLLITLDLHPHHRPLDPPQALNLNAANQT